MWTSNYLHSIRLTKEVKIFKIISKLFLFHLGLTRCGWMYRDGIRTPQASQFTALFLTDVPVVNGNKAWCIFVKNLNLTVDLGRFSGTFTIIYITGTT